MVSAVKRAFVTKYFENTDRGIYSSTLGKISYAQSHAKKPDADTIVFIHGWPFNALSFRKLQPLLQEQYNCVMVDLPGMGQSKFDPVKGRATNFATMAKVLSEFLNEVFDDPVTIVAHDTGATIARLMLSEYAARVKKLICFSTEIPAHRPAFIQLFQTLTKLPFSAPVFGAFLRSNLFLHSAMGFKNCFHDRANLDADFLKATIDTIPVDRMRRAGLIRYLHGIDWKIVDQLRDIHARITQPVLFILGERDEIFPLEKAKIAIKGYEGPVTLETIPNAGFLVFEETPAAAAQMITSFMNRR